MLLNVNKSPLDTTYAFYLNITSNISTQQKTKFVLYFMDIHFTGVQHRIWKVFLKRKQFSMNKTEFVSTF